VNQHSLAPAVLGELWSLYDLRVTECLVALRRIDVPASPGVIELVNAPCRYVLNRRSGE
jgi:hypothetical protein